VIRLLGPAILSALVVVACSPPPRTDPVPSDPPASVERPSEIAKLIDQLGAETIEVRQEAHLKLTKAGPAASPELVKALQHPDPEVARSAKSILKDLNRRPDRGFPARELSFQNNYGLRFGEPDSWYFLSSEALFGGFAKTTASAVMEWMQAHPRARAVPVWILVNEGKSGKWCYVWIEDDTENLNLHLVERGMVTGHSMRASVEPLVSPSEIASFLDRARVAQRKAREARAGIWNPDTPMEMSAREPWQIRAEACMFEEAHAPALEEWKRGLKEHFNKEEVWMQIASCHDKLGHYEETLAAYDEVLKTMVCEDAFLGRMHAMSRKEGADKAERWFDEYEKQYPNVYDFDVHRGRFHLEEKRYDRAIELFKRRLDVVMRVEKIAFDDRGNVKVEVVDGRRRYKNYIQVSSFLGMLAEAYLLKGDRENALRCATMGITAGQAWYGGMNDWDPAQLDAGDAPCRIVRARLHLASGKLEEARADLAAAKALLIWPREEEAYLSADAQLKEMESRKSGK
jgi:tetratricopeptide (TPR) repeat protein